MRKFQLLLKLAIQRVENFLSKATSQELSSASESAVQRSLELLRQLRDFLDQGATDMDILTNIRLGFEDIIVLLPEWLQALIGYIVVYLCLALYGLDCFCPNFPLCHDY